jgi:hypothetical protein
MPHNQFGDAEVKDTMDKWVVIEELRRALAVHPDMHNKFEWLLKVWNTDRDHPYPSLAEGFPHEQEQENK